jgi:tetrapyrrole methylase family protein/MazG family protein
VLIHAAGTPEEQVESLPLYAIDRSEQIGALTVLYLPPLPMGAAFEDFFEIVAHLRAPDGCPWDRKQTHRSLRSHLLEETYEALAALDAGDFNKMREEFGDLLLQIVLHAVIAAEEGEFNIADVVQGVSEKIIRRHPHVFGDVQADDAETVLQNWEKLKQAEREANGETEKSLLDGISPAMPALAVAQKYQERAARVGFDWPVVEEVLDKILEEVHEVRTARNQDELAAELGDLFFVLVNFCRWQGVDAESALREANRRFYRRFSYIERMARRQGRSLESLTLDEMETFWQQAKTLTDDMR